MPDPNAHADGLLSPAIRHELPPLWWINPWHTAKALLDALDLASLDIIAERNKAKDFEQRWLETNEALLKEQGDHDETSEKSKGHKVAAEGFRKALTIAMMEKEEADRDHAEEHKANLLLHGRVAELEQELVFLKASGLESGKKAKRKAKKKAVRRG